MIKILVMTLTDVVDNEVIANIKLNTLKTKINNAEKKILHKNELIHINQYSKDEQKFEEKNGIFKIKYQIRVVQ